MSQVEVTEVVNQVEVVQQQNVVEITVGVIQTGSEIWDRTGTTISPINAGDNLDMGTGSVYADKDSEFRVGTVNNDIARIGADNSGGYLNLGSDNSWRQFWFTTKDGRMGIDTFQNNNPNGAKMVFDNIDDQIEVNSWDFVINTVTPSTDTSTGALIVAGGVGVADDVHIGGELYLDKDATGPKLWMKGTSSKDKATFMHFVTSTEHQFGIGVSNYDQSINWKSGPVAFRWFDIDGNNNMATHIGPTKSNRWGKMPNDDDGYRAMVMFGLDENIGYWRDSTAVSVRIKKYTGYGGQSGPLLLVDDATTDFLRIDANGIVNLDGTTASTSTTTGALVVGGGVGIAGGVYAGGDSAINGILAVNNSDSLAQLRFAQDSGAILYDASGTDRHMYYWDDNDATYGAIVGPANRAENGKVGIWANTATGGAGGEVLTSLFEDDLIDFKVTTTVTDTTASTSTTTGALQVAGGVGVQGKGYFGGGLTVSGSILQASNRMVAYSNLDGGGGEIGALESAGQITGGGGSTTEASCYNKPSFQNMTGDYTGAPISTAANRSGFRTTSNFVTAGINVTGIADFYSNTDLSTAIGGGDLTIANAYGFYYENIPALATNVAVTNQYGIYIEEPTRGTTNYAIKTAGGNINFSNLPTSSAGLATGDLWNDSGTVKIV